MKKYILFAIFLAAIALSSFGQEQPASYVDLNGVRVSLLEFREDGDNLLLVYSMDMPARPIRRWRGLNLTLGIEAADTTILFPTVTVVGPNKRRVLTRYYRNNHLEPRDFYAINWRDPHSFVTEVELPFRAWMDNAQVFVRKEVANYRGRNVFTYHQLGAHVQLEPVVAHNIVPQVALLIPAREAKILERSGTAFLDFPVGQSVIQPNFRRNPDELARIDEAVRSVVNNPDATLETIYIRGFASPEGTAASNQRLSEARATALQNRLHTMYNIPHNRFRTSGAGEDWEGLVAQLNRNIVHVPNQGRILHIIATEHNLDRREQQIRSLDQNAWNIMLRDLFPDLRRVEYRINYTIRDYTIEDARTLIDRRPTDLSHYEMFHVAEHYGRGSERANHIIINMIAQQFPNDPLAQNNAAALLIQRGDLALANAHLQRAGNNAAANNNRGVIALLEGDLDRAENYFTRAQADGAPEAAHNREQLRKVREANARMERFQSR